MGSSSKRLQYVYDVRGNRRSLADAEGGRFTYAYDSRNRISSVVNPQAERTTFSYNALSQRTVTRLANGTRASFSYDAVSNLASLSNLKSDGSPISSFQYAYDRTGNRTSVLQGDGTRVTWSYDAASQLLSEERGGNSWESLSLDGWGSLTLDGWNTLSADAVIATYAYDPAGNRTLKNEAGVRTTYSYDAADQLQWAQATAGRTTYTFDADGNQQRVLAPDGSRTTTAWDYENRTTSTQLPAGIRNTMAYEPTGLRVKLEGAAGMKKFVWDDQNYLAETDASNDTQVVYTNEPRLYGNLVSQRRGATANWYHFDGLGSTRDLTDVAQAVTDERVYDAWGTVIQSSGTTAFPFQHAGSVGYYTDKDRDAIYIRARIYQPSIARWWSVDPLATIESLYKYSSNSPTLALDASGMDDEQANDEVRYRGWNGNFHVDIGPRDSDSHGDCCTSKIQVEFRPNRAQRGVYQSIRLRVFVNTTQKYEGLCKTGPVWWQSDPTLNWDWHNDDPGNKKEGRTDWDDSLPGLPARWYDEPGTGGSPGHYDTCPTCRLVQLVQSFEVCAIGEYPLLRTTQRRLIGCMQYSVSCSLHWYNSIVVDSLTGAPPVYERLPGFTCCEMNCDLTYPKEFDSTPMPPRAFPKKW